MAIALVGSVGTAVTGTGTLSPAFGQATTAGNLLVAWIGSANGGGTGTLTGTGWTQAVQSSDASSNTVAVWYRANCGSGESAPTLSAPGLTQTIALAEFSGAATTSPLDQIGSKNSFTSASPLSITNAGTDAGSGELVLAVGYDFLTKSATTTTSLTFNNGASSTNAGNNDATSSTNHYRFAYGLTTGNSVADNVSYADSSMNLQGAGLACCLASFLVAAALPPAAHPIRVGASFAAHSASIH